MPVGPWLARSVQVALVVTVVTFHTAPSRATVQMDGSVETTVTGCPEDAETLSGTSVGAPI